MVHPVSICSVSFTSYLHFSVAPSPVLLLNATCPSSLRTWEGIMPRTSQQSSFPGWRLYPCRLPSSWALACFSILFYLSFASYFSFTRHTIHFVFVTVFLLRFSPLCSSWHPKLCLFRVFVTWQDSPVVWPVLNYLYSSMGLWDVACPGAFQ